MPTVTLSVGTIGRSRSSRTQDAEPMDNKSADLCYVLEDGTCVSPFDCQHGDSLRLTKFLQETDRAGCTYAACFWLICKLTDVRRVIK